MNQFCERSCVESKLFFRHRGYQLGARLVIRLVEHVLPRLPAELLSVGGSQERALMMIEPPCHLRRTGILEIDDDILIAVEDAPSHGWAARWVMPVNSNSAPMS